MRKKIVLLIFPLDLDVFIFRCTTIFYTHILKMRFNQINIDIYLNEEPKRLEQVSLERLDKYEYVYEFDLRKFFDTAYMAKALETTKIPETEQLWLKLVNAYTIQQANNMSDKQEFEQQSRYRHMQNIKGLSPGESIYYFA